MNFSIFYDRPHVTVEILIDAWKAFLDFLLTVLVCSISERFFLKPNANKIPDFLFISNIVKFNKRKLITGFEVRYLLEVAGRFYLVQKLSDYLQPAEMLSSNTY